MSSEFPKRVELIGGPLNGETRNLLFGNEARCIEGDKIHVYKEGKGDDDRFLYSHTEDYDKPDTEGLTE